MTVTIRDVAEKAGVSNATVSRVLANHPYVREEVRKRVLAAAADLRYQPSHVSRSFRIRKSKIIGLIVSDVINPFFTSLVRCVEDRASSHGYAVILCNSNEDLQRESNYLDFMLSERVAGVLLTPVQVKNCASKRLLDAGIPVVCVDRTLDDLEVDSVMVDNAGGTFQLTEHLIQNGHERIGAIFGELSATGRLRENGFRNALLVHNIPIREEYIQRGMPRENEGQMLTRQLLQLPQPPTAILCGNNLLTIGALRAILEQGLVIPDDVAVAGFDDLEWYGLVQPSITAVFQPTQQIGRTAVDILFRRIGGDKSASYQVILPTELRIRCSSTKRIVSHA